MPAEPSTERRSGGAGRVSAFLRTYATLTPNARRLLAATTLLWVGIGISGVLFNLYLVDIGHGVAFVGLLAAVSTVGQASVSPVLSRLLRRWNAKTVMLVATALAAATMAASAVFTFSALLLLATVLQGIGIAAATIPSSPFIMEQASAEQRTHLFSAYTASTNLGSTFGSLLSGALPAVCALLPFVRDHAVAQDRIGLLLGAGITALGAISLWGITVDNEQEETIGVAAPVVDEEPIDEDQARGDLMAMMAASACIAVSLGVIFPLFNVYFATVHHASAGQIGLLYAASGVFGTVGSLLGPVVARRGSLQGLVALRLLTAPILFSFWARPGLGIACGAYISRNILGQVAGILENTFAMETVPARLRAAVASWRTFSFNVGWTAGSLVAGVVVSRYGYDPVFVASTVLTFAGALIWLRRFGSRKLLQRYPLLVNRKKGPPSK